MAKWTKADLIALDKKYAESGISPHQRPILAAVELLGGESSLGMFGNPEVAAITRGYRELFPEMEETWPGAGIGLIASVDQVRRFKLGVAYGRVSVPVWRGVGFDSLAAWEAWCRHDPEIAAETALAFADLHDFSNGVEIAGPQNPEAAKRWHMAASNLSDVANVLPAAFSVDSVLQPIHLIVELSLKASLTFLGEGTWGHKLPALAADLARLRPHRDDVAVCCDALRLSGHNAGAAHGVHKIRLGVRQAFARDDAVRWLVAVQCAHRFQHCRI